MQRTGEYNTSSDFCLTLDRQSAEAFLRKKNLSTTVVSTKEVWGISPSGQKQEVGHPMMRLNTFLTHTKYPAMGVFYESWTDFSMLYRVTTSQSHIASFYHRAELPKWILSSLCHQSGKIRLIRDGVMLALHTIEGTEGGHVELWKQRESNAEKSNKKAVLMEEAAGKPLVMCLYFFLCI